MKVMTGVLLMKRKLTSIKGAPLQDTTQNTRLKNRSNMSTTVNTEILQLMKKHSVEHNIPLSRLVDEAFLMFLREYESDDQVDQIEI